MIYEVVYFTDSFIDGFETASLEQGKCDALDLLVGWKPEGNDWYGNRMPTEDEIVAWDHMILNYGVEVVRYDESEAPDGCPNYEIVWEPSDEDLDRIGWVEWEEMAESYKSLMDTINAKGE